MVQKSIFDFSDYREYLLYRVGPKTQRLGIKSGIAKALNCQPTFISQVLASRSEFNLEQGERVSGYLGLTSDETRFFLLLIQRTRAGTQGLKRIIDEQIQEQLIKRLSLTQRLGQIN